MRARRTALCVSLAVLGAAVLVQPAFSGAPASDETRSGGQTAAEQGQQGGNDANGNGQSAQKGPKLSPEQKMAQRFPQPVKVSYLVGLPVRDERQSTVGNVRSVSRTSQGKIELIVSYGGVLGWGSRPVAVPVEFVAMLGKQVALVDLPDEQLAKAASWNGEGSEVAPNETIRVAVIRR